MGLLYGENYKILTSTVFAWITRVTDGRTDRQTDGIAIACARLAYTRGLVRAGPSFQLGTLSTRIANLCIILSALSRLSWRAYGRRPCYARHTLSGLAALCRTPRRSIYSADRQTDTRHDLLTGQPAKVTVPSWKLGMLSRAKMNIIYLRRSTWLLDTGRERCRRNWCWYLPSWNELQSQNHGNQQFCMWRSVVNLVDSLLLTCVYCSHQPSPLLQQHLGLLIIFT